MFNMAPSELVKVAASMVDRRLVYVATSPIQKGEQVTPRVVPVVSQLLLSRASR
jgi:hypothetical protein